LQPGSVSGKPAGLTVHVGTPLFRLREHNLAEQARVVHFDNLRGKAEDS